MFVLRPHTQRSAADRLAPWSTRARNQGLIGQRIDSRHGNDQERCSSGQADSPHWERALPGPEDGVGRDSERSSDEEQPGQGLRVEDVVDLATGTRNLGEVSQPAGFEALGKPMNTKGSSTASGTATSGRNRVPRATASDESLHARRQPPP